MLAPSPELRVQRVESALGSWTIGTWSPRDLADVVDVIWYFEGSLAHRRERVFPNGALEIIAHLGDDVYREVRADAVDAYSRTCVTGQMLSPLVIEAPGARTAVLGIRLRATGGFSLFGRPVHDITGYTADLADVAGIAGAALAERCAEATGAEARLCAAAEWVRARRRCGAEPDAAVAWAADQVRRSGGSMAVADIQARTGWSVSRFTRSFREQVGIPPKTLARVVRFGRALERVRCGTEPLGAIAVESGYYDQAHFNADFREFAGFSPTEYRARAAYPSTASLVEP